MSLTLLFRTGLLHRRPVWQ